MAKTLLQGGNVLRNSVLVALASTVGAPVYAPRAAAAADLAEYIEAEDPNLLSLARTLARRNHGRSRAVVVASSSVSGPSS